MMKVNRKQFIEELNFVKAASEKMGTIPVLAFMLIRKISEGVAEIIATDLDRTLRSRVEIEQIESSFTLPTKKISDMIGKLEANEMEITLETNGWVKVKNGNAVFRMACQPLDNYPEIPLISGEKLRITAGLLLTLIKNTLYAVTEEQSRFTLSGGKLLEVDGEWRMVATDGHRMAMMNTSAFADKAGPGDKNVRFDALVPRKALTDLQKMIADCTPETEVIIGEDPNHLSFSVGHRVMQCRKLSGTFPNYHMVVPSGTRKAVIVKTQSINDVLRRVSLMADERTRSVALLFKNEEITFSSKSSEEGEASETIKAAGIDQDESVEIGFNSQYLMEVCRLAENEQHNMKDDERNLAVEYDPTNPNSQWTFKTAGLEERNLQGLGVIMPLRI